MLSMFKVTDQHNLSVVNPKLAQEWHPSKNGKLRPGDVTPMSHKKVWWQCRRGHEWEADSHHRSRGMGCPYCGNKKVCKDNCLATKNPKLAKEWHLTKNGELTPEDVTPGSAKKVWWQCKKGHEYASTVYSKFNGNGCPYCGGKRACEDNSLATVNPKLASEWHPTKNGHLTPNDVIPGSSKKVWWMCMKNHEWIATSNNRSNGSDCPYCIGKKATKETCLATVNPTLAGEWHPIKNGGLTPKDIRPFSSTEIWWCCKRGHEWKSKVASRSLSNGCPYCLNQKVCKDNCLAAVNPELAREWHSTKNGPLSPEEVMSGSETSVWWLCSKGHEWQSKIKERAKGCGCPYCGNKKVCKDNCLATLNPKLASEWHPTKNGILTPKDVVPGSTKKSWWQCEKGHEWQAIPKHRSNGSGCPYCGKKKACQENCLAIVNPKLANDWHPTKNGTLTPEDVTPNSAQKVWWQCKKGHEWKVGPNGRSAGQDCPYCSNRKSCDDNCLAIKHPKLTKEWHPTKNAPLTPEKVTPGSAKEVWWQCRRGHEWKADVGSRSRGYGCPFCYYQISSVELRIYTELRFIFEDIKQKEKIGGKECDIYIPSLQIGIEYDGEYWHRNKSQKDLDKNLFFKKRGITLIRIRELPLRKVAQHDIDYNYSRGGDLSLIKRLLKTLQKISNLEKSVFEKIDFYLEREEFANDKYFVELQELLPSPAVAASLALLKPSLAREWHPTKNGKLTPEQVTPGSGTKIWWQCNRGHEWKTTCSHRSKGRGCPFCSNKKVCLDNCLLTVNPKLASEWHPTKNGMLTPQHVTRGVNKKVWWQCDKGHEWKAPVADRSNGTRCPYCSGRRSVSEKHQLKLDI